MYCYHFPTLASFSCFETSFKTNFLFFNGPFPFELRGCFCSWCYLLCFCGEPFYHGPPFLWDVLLGSFSKKARDLLFFKDSAGFSWDCGLKKFCASLRSLFYSSSSVRSRLCIGPFIMMTTITFILRLFVNAVVVWSRSFVGFSICEPIVSKLIWVVKTLFSKVMVLH